MRNIPKIELHCHLDGSLRVETIIDIAKQEKVDIELDYDKLKAEVQAQKDCKSLNEYLSKFEIPIKILQSKYALQRATYELVEDASKENVKYIEIRFAPQFHRKKGLTYDEIITSVSDGIRKAEEQFDIKARLILTVMRLDFMTDGLDVVESGKKYLNDKVVAIDLAGPEEEHFANKYKHIIDQAKEYGYNVTIHAGEAASAQNVIDSINILGATRIGHGIKIENMKEAYELVKQKGIMLEMCPTSNIQTKNAVDYKSYPLYDFYNDGINVSINTDNRCVSNIDLTYEIESIITNSKLEESNLIDMYKTMAKASFCDDQTKEWILSKLN